MVDDIIAKVAFDDTSSTSSSSSRNNPDRMARIRSIFAVKSTKSIRLKKEEESKPLMLKSSQSISSNISLPESKQAEVQSQAVPGPLPAVRISVVKAGSAKGNKSATSVKQAGGKKRSISSVLNSKNIHSRKKKLVTITEQFNCEQKEGKTEATCIYCEQKVQSVVKLNVTRLRQHLMICSKIPMEKRRLSLTCSQRAYKIAKIKSLTPERSVKTVDLGSPTVGSELMTDLRKHLPKLERNDNGMRSKMSQQKISSFGTV